MSQRVGKIVWQTDVSPAAWLHETLEPWGQGVTSIIPGGFSSYARILHPAGGSEPPGGECRTWTTIARENGRLPHSTMQFHNIVRPRGSPSSNPGETPSPGALPLAERKFLIDLLATETHTPNNCWFCMWDGWGKLDNQGVSTRVQLPGRQYFLYGGPVEAASWVPPLAVDSATVAAFVPPESSAPEQTREHKERILLDLWREGPALWWPEDRSWVVATEIDLAWTYVGASEHAIQRLLKHSRLEAWRAQPRDPFAANSDPRNAALDNADST